QINPFDLDWQRFLVAEENGKIVGVGQVKPHPDGSRELASIAVIPSCQGQGIGSNLVRALLARGHDTLFLTCRAPLEAYYARFGFRRATDQELPPHFRRIILVQMFVPIKVIVMKHGNE
ncbi:MAG TPA: GNAT family N-acetyltransferase, partial [Anaerolineae bacterium]|nr:GNAT family N-acetyltransferase [Anaerolineae bacterium]